MRVRRCSWANGLAAVDHGKEGAGRLKIRDVAMMQGLGGSLTGSKYPGKEGKSPYLKGRYTNIPLAEPRYAQCF